MITRVLSLVRRADAGAARAADPALDLNAYAVAEDVELTLVLQDRGVELALESASCHPGDLAGIEVPAAVPATDLRALLGSGVRVLAISTDLAARGLAVEDLVAGVAVIEPESLADMLMEHDVTLTTA